MNVNNLKHHAALAEEVRCAVRAVLGGLKLSPGGDAYEYRGTTSEVDWLSEATDALENFQIEHLP